MKYGAGANPPVTDTTPRPETSHATETTGVARGSAPVGWEDTERLLERGEAALTDTERAAAFRARGGVRALRRLAERGDDPAVRKRAIAVVRAFDRLRQAVWGTRRPETPND
ncbi:MAG: hypothetical protein J07HB67_00550 [halophilic archaeon J07HB67]|nr:MAG: hypothetical protein J07HB67_00550 [halophilic archaeon J07HB67]